MADRITVKASGEPSFTYELADDGDTQYQFTVKRGSANIAYACIEL